MTPELIAAKVAKGYGKAASKLGLSHSIFRPRTALVAPLDPANWLIDLPFIASATPDGQFKRPGNWTAPEYYALVDNSDLLSGDYINGPSGTWFVATFEALTIPMVIECNVVVSGARSAGIQAGLNTTYGGRTTATDAPEFFDWPASIIQGGSSESPRAGLPGDPKRVGGAFCKIPKIPGVNFRIGDRIAVEGGDTWMISAAFLQSQGWHLTLVSAEA